MKTLKLIVLMLLAANFVMAQNNTFYGTNAGENGQRNSNFGVTAGQNVTGTDNTNIGFGAGKNVTGTHNTFVGQSAGSGAGTSAQSVGIGRSSLGEANGTRNIGIGFEAGLFTAGGNNVFIGDQSGRDAINTTRNVGIGSGALRYNDGGNNNLAIGASAGLANTSGSQNVYMGSNAGYKNTEGSYNICIGASSGSELVDGSRNLFIGRSAGTKLVNGSGNIFIGYQAGDNNSITNISDQLYIESSNDVATPLIYGDFATKQVGIGTSDVPRDDNGNALYTLAVRGKTITEEVQVVMYDASNGGWPDYVFDEDYNLMSLADLEEEIETLGHLPGVPSAEEVEENGHALGQMDAILLEKIEELTLHLIDMNKEMTELRERNEALETRLSEVEEK